MKTPLLKLILARSDSNLGLENKLLKTLLEIFDSGPESEIENELDFELQKF